MKRFLFCPVIILLSLTASSQTNTWIGGASGSWSANANWSQGHEPTSSENIVINTTSTINLSSFSSGVRAILSLKITGGVTVRLTCSVNGTRYLRMSGTSAITKGLQVDAGSTLIFDATNTAGTGNWICDLTGAAGVTASIDGTLQFEGTGSGTGGAALDLYSSIFTYANAVVSSTGRIIYKGNTGETDAGSGTYFTMQAGSVFELNDDGGTIPKANWDAGSMVKVITTSATPPVFDGTNYGDVEIDCAGITSPLSFNKNISFRNFNIINTGFASVMIRSVTGTSPYTLTVNGNLDISSSAKLELAKNTSLNDSTGNISVKGNVINNGMVTADDGDEPNRFEFAGNASQSISGSGSWFGSHLALVVNNPAGITLLSPLMLKCGLVFGRGNIRTDATNILTMAKSSSYPAYWSGASSASFVDGPMRNVSTGTWITFPVGKGNYYAPIGYYHILNHMLTDTFRAEYFRGNPQSVYGNSYDAAGNPEVIHHISSIEYWSLTSNGVFATNSIEPHVTTGSFCQDMANTFTARFDPSANKWKNVGTVARNVDNPGPPYATGYLQSNYSEGGIFTLATNSASNPLADPAQGPLPIHLIAFDAAKINSSSSIVSWQLAEYSSADEKFVIQRAVNDNNYIVIGTVSGNENSRLYNYIDNDLKNGVNYYRLKMIDKDGKITYSRTVAVMNNVNGLLLTSLMPTVVNNSATLTISSSGQQKITIVIVDMQGRIMKREDLVAMPGNTGIQLSMDRLAAGIYQMKGITPEGETNVIRFIKQ